MTTHALSRLGRGAARHPWAVISTWFVLVVLVAGAASAFGAKLQDSMSAPGVDSQRASGLLASVNAEDGGLTAQVVLTPRADGASFFDSPAAAEALTRLQQKAEQLPNVLGTSDPAGALAHHDLAQGHPAGSAPTGAAPFATASGTISPDGRVALLRLNYPPVEQLDAADLDRLKTLADDPVVNKVLRVELGGDLFFVFESPPANLGELLGVLAAAIILLLAFGSLVAASLPLIVAIAGLAVGISAMSLLANLFTVPTFAPVIGSMVGLGVGIDYALFIVTRHRDNLRRGLSVDDAAGRSLATAGRPVVFAGGIVVLSILGLAVAGVPFMTAGAVAISVVVLIMVIASVTLLPALLGLVGHRIVRRRERSGPGTPIAHTGQPGWERWIGHVARHAGGYAVAATLLLIALAAPILAMRVGLPDDGALPTDRTQRRAYDLVADGFGPGSNGPLAVVADLNGDRAAARALAEAIRADRGVASVAQVRIDDAADLATMVVLPTTGPQDQATYETIQRLRADVFPAVLAGSPAQAHVGGNTALMADVGGRVFDRLPYFVAAVLGLSFLLLLVVFRSVLVALKAVVLNLLSIGAAYGLLVMVFQWGWGAGLIGLESTVPIVSFIPMFMFAILFGLSMDYEVFLLARVREEYGHTGDNHAAVVRGISSTARVITSAALIMVTVFMSFVLGPDPATKTMGLGLAAAILIDATIVRMVLVPATMTLLGKANWWLPGWLDRILPRVDGEQQLEDDQRPPRVPLPARVG